MEARNVNSLLVVCLVLGMVVGQSTAAFQDCFVGCVGICVSRPSHDIIICGLTCLKQCIKPSSVINIETDTHYHCKLGCATSLCANISTKENINGAKVEGCVDSCSNACTKN
ncbi:To encode a PR protein, Belongs to the plant thionin family with the following members:, putative [Fagus crenata]